MGATMTRAAVALCACALLASPSRVCSRSTRTLLFNPEGTDGGVGNPDADDHHDWHFKDAFKEYGEYVGDHLDTTFNAFGEQFTEHVTPRLSVYEDDFRHTYDMITNYESQIESKVASYVGPKYSKMASWIIVLSLIVMPISVFSLIVIDKLTSSVTMESVLVFCNGYGALYFLAMIGLTAYAGTDPMTILQKSNSDAYILFQLAVAAMYSLYVVVHICMLCSIQLMAVATIRMVSCACMGLHYYLNVWQPAMMDKEPNLGDNVYTTYGVYALVYMINCLLPSVPIVGGKAVMQMLEDLDDEKKEIGHKD